MGIRISSRAVGSTEIKAGPPKAVRLYCENSLQEIENILQGENNSPKIKKEYINNYDSDSEPYPRYQGLETGKIQIDCGSEIINVGDSPNKKISYSNPFFETGLKLLIKKESFEKVTNKDITPKLKLIEEIKDEVYIGIFKKRINVAKILKEQGFIKYKKYDNDLQLKDDLEHGKIQAYVDDTLSIAEFFHEFIENDNESQNKFLIYPPEGQDYFFDGYNTKLRYVFAFAGNADNSDFYQNKINEITSFNQKTSDMKRVEDRLANEAKKLYPQPNEMENFLSSILIQIIDVFKSFILYLLPYKTLIGAILLTAITLYNGKKNGEKLKIPDCIATTNKFKEGLDSLLKKN